MTAYDFMRTGFSEVDTSVELDMAKFVLGCLRVFAIDAAETAGKYAIGRDRLEVTADDMCRGLKYQARLFFQNSKDEATLERIREQIELMETESDEESEESEGEGEEEREVAAAEGDMEAESEGDMEAESEEAEAEGGEGVDEEFRLMCKKLVPCVDKIYETWNLWEPDDQVLCMIKSAIDRTAVPTE